MPLAERGICPWTKDIYLLAARTYTSLEQQLSRSLDALYDAQHFVQEPSNTRLSRQEYDTRLDMICEKLVASFVENSLLFETIFERRALAARDKRSRKGTGRKGTRTAYMERQLETFQTFILDGHPVSGREPTRTVNLTVPEQ